MIVKSYKTKEEVLTRGREAIGIPMKEIDKTGRLSIGKGAIGSVLEESWFGYSINSESVADFAEAGVELKATPYLKTKNGIRAKERLVCNIINYMEEYKRTFYTSDFWKKCNTMLIMSYEHKEDIPKDEFTIDEVTLFSFPMSDLIIIEQDWKTIMDKVRAGKAHEISEGDTLYLGACTKGANSASMREQPFSDIPAKQRAYSLKSSYMTYVLNTYIFGKKCDENIIKDPTSLQKKGFERYITDKVSQYIGLTQNELKRRFSVVSNAKNLNEILLSKMLDIKGKIAYTEEFQKANIVPKTIRINKNGKIKESMSFPVFDFNELVKETWEDATFNDYLSQTKFLFIIFRENVDGEYVFDDLMFWSISEADLEEVKNVWERTVEVLKRGVTVNLINGRIHNNLPKQSENPVAHVRPHAKDSSDTLKLPDGRDMPKQCFWLNNTYILKQIIKHKELGERHETS